jgi:septal ring factor EnvC (AmiA/AmiB activator)
VVKQLNSSLQHHLAAAQGGAYPPEVLEQLKAIEAEMEANREQHQRIATEKKEVRALMRELRNEDGKYTTHTAHAHTHLRRTR